MIEFGETLRLAREAKGLTASEIAQKTHLLVQQVEALEREDFSKIAAPIYGRGFVRLYCEALGIDPRPLIDEFMEIYNGNREPVIKRRTVMPPRNPPAPPAPPPVNDIPATPPPDDIPPPPPESVPADALAETTQPSRSAPAFVLEQESVPAPAPAIQRPLPQKRMYANPYATLDRFDSRDDKPGFKLDIPPYVWRIAVLAGIGLVAIWLLYAGIRALYRASMSAPETTPAAQETESVQTPAIQANAANTGTGGGNESVPKGRTERSPLNITPLYID